MATATRVAVAAALVTYPLSSPQHSSTTRLQRTSRSAGVTTTLMQSVFTVGALVASFTYVRSVSTKNTTPTLARRGTPSEQPLNHMSIAATRASWIPRLRSPSRTQRRNSYRGRRRSANVWFVPWRLGGLTPTWTHQPKRAWNARWNMILGPLQVKRTTAHPGQNSVRSGGASGRRSWRGSVAQLSLYTTAAAFAHQGVGV